MPQTEPHTLSEEEADRIIAEIVAPHDLLVALLAYGGLRIGEAFALRRQSIDLDAGTVTISESLVEIEGHLSFDTPKSHQARTVTLPSFVIERLRQRLREIDPSPGALLFPSTAARPQHYNAWRSAYFDPAVKAAGLTDVTPHDLRASHATWVAERHGVMAAAARLGHAHASVTTRHYARAAPGQDRTVADDLDRVIRELLAVGEAEDAGDAFLEQVPAKLHSARGIDVFEDERAAGLHTFVDAREERVALRRRNPVQDVVKHDDVECAADAIVKSSDESDVRVFVRSERLP